MITIFNNATCNAICSASTLDEARELVGPTLAPIDAVFGEGAADYTAIDAPGKTWRDFIGVTPREARAMHTVISASGRVRMR